MSNPINCSSFRENNLSNNVHKIFVHSPLSSYHQQPLVRKMMQISREGSKEEKKKRGHKHQNGGRNGTAREMDLDNVMWGTQWLMCVLFFFELMTFALTFSTTSPRQSSFCCHVFRISDPQVLLSFVFLIFIHIINICTFFF